jgi:LacI family transcriptional regulator
MHDVARLAGVSLKTVSRVINQEARVAPETAARVLDAVAELGFERNELARSLRSGGRSATLGLIIGDLASPACAAIAQAVESVADERRYVAIICCCGDDPGRVRDRVVALLRRRVDALLVAGTAAEHDGWARRAHVAGVPVVFMNRPPPGMVADAVLPDDRGGARTAVEHLATRGHRRIAYLGGLGPSSTAIERYAGYRAAIEAGHGPGPQQLVRLSRDDDRAAQTAARELLGLAPGIRPTALITGSRRHTIAALRAFREVGSELAVVGFDDFEAADLLARPPTVVRYDTAQLGRQAAELAFARLDGAQWPPRRIVVRTEIVPRGSGELTP